MSFLERAIRNGIRKGVGDAVSKAVQQVVEPAATKLANQAAESIDQIAGQTQQSRQNQRQSYGFEGALGNLQRSAERYATEAAKNVKLCPACGAPAAADQSFCPQCGASLPEMTVAQGAVCTSCGQQNAVGTKFCTNCGTKLPAAQAEEAAEAARGAAVLDRWEEVLGAYPKWRFGGTPVDIECLDPGVYSFYVDFKGNASAARQAVRDYLALARQQGFHPAGKYPSQENLYNRVNGVCYYLDTEHAFDGDSDCPTITFALREPEGGYDYVEPAPVKKTSLFDLFK